MAIKDIIDYPNPILKNQSSEIKNIDGDLIKLIEDMTETVYSARGVGLAAPQVGVNKRLILADETGESGSGRLNIVLNPVITEMEGSELDSEACLSVPEFSIELPRASHILVKGVNQDGKDIELELNGFLARIFQHEIDHLDGQCIIDYASRLKRGIYVKKRKKGTL